MQSLDKNGLRKFKQLSDSKYSSSSATTVSFKFPQQVGGLRTIELESPVPFTSNSEKEDFSAWWSMLISVTGSSKFMCPQGNVPYDPLVRDPSFLGLCVVQNGTYFAIGAKTGVSGIVMGAGSTKADAVSSVTVYPQTVPISMGTTSGFDLVFY